MVGGGERVAIAAVTELELAFKIGAPEVVRMRALGQRRSLGAVPAPPLAADQAVAVENGVDRAAGWDPEIAGKAADQQLADFAGAPSRILRAPQCGLSFLDRTIKASICGGSWLA